MDKLHGCMVTEWNQRGLFRCSMNFMRGFENYTVVDREVAPVRVPEPVTCAWSEFKRGLCWNLAC